MSRQAGTDAAPAGRRAALGRELVRLCRALHARGWALATSGNLSAVLSAQPLRLLITASGVDKGAARRQDLVEIDGAGRVVGRRAGKPSDETPLHLELVAARAARAVLHTHSVWGTLLSERHAHEGGLALEGLEMLKALAGVTTHAHREWLPIIGNRQDRPRLALELRAALELHPAAHGVLLRGHGLYVWGDTLAQAMRQLEALELLLEVRGRTVAAADRT